MGDKPTIRYEDAAEYRTDVAGWVCRVCGQYCGTGGIAEHAARRHCATDLPCPECGGRRSDKGYTRCLECVRKHDDARWAALERVEWDGVTPLCEWRGDRYYFDEDEVAGLVAGTLADGGSVADIRLVLCGPDEPRRFEMAEFLADQLPGDFEPGPAFAGIDGVVNGWIAANLTRLWVPTDRAISAGSLEVYIEPNEDSPI
jgi:hypothetical protein